MHFENIRDWQRYDTFHLVCPVWVGALLSSEPYGEQAQMSTCWSYTS